MKMQQHKKNKIAEKSISLFEIFVFVISIFAFAYFIGNDFKFVSATGAGGTTSSEGTLADLGETAESAAEAVTNTASATTDESIDIIAGIEEANGLTETVSSATVPTSTVADAVSGGGSNTIVFNGASATVSGGGSNTLVLGAKGASTSINLGPIVQTALTRLASTVGVLAANWAIATAIYYGVVYGTAWLCPTCNTQTTEDWAFALEMGWGIGSTVGYIISLFAPSLIAGTVVASAWAWALMGGGAGLILAVLYMLFVYNENYIVAVQYNCYPWKAASGGENCGNCNSKEFPCTEYECESLGQACNLTNVGTTDQMCIWLDRTDITSPTISAWLEALPAGYSYTDNSAKLPPDKGVIIKYSGSDDGCIPIWSILTFGVNLNKLGTCKTDIVRKNNFDDMTYTLSNGKNLYNHTIYTLHGGITNSEYEDGVELPNGGTYEVFVRCESVNGYANTGTFSFKYCVDDEPDTTPPTITLTSPVSGYPVAKGQTTLKTLVYTDKPSDCRWSHEDEDYDSMDYAMTCSQTATEVSANMYYKCNTTLTGLKDETTNTFYFRCKSYPGYEESDRYKNRESTVYTVIGTEPLYIDEISPEDGTTIKDSTTSIKVSLNATTSGGYNDGEAYCYFKKSTASDSSYIRFANTISYKSSQNLWISEGSYSYSIKCCDLGGNCDYNETSFSVETDVTAPTVIRMYNDGSDLKIITNEEASCVYDTTSCDYEFDNGIAMITTDGLEHTTEWNTNSDVYIKCEDEFGKGPGSDCSVIIRPFTLS